ncbi:DUF3072 domain-containing protein [Nocardioides sp. T5]|uniref:DUF3072 domain-containing protein n=1 Tax=Nocardioides sp. T5 TaxID=3400182 RepID=UPI003A842FFC
MSESNVSSNSDTTMDPTIDPTTDAAPGDPQQEVLGGPQGDSTRKDPEEWVTGDEPMTGAQRSYLDTLAREAGEQLPADLTKAEASEHIDRLQSASDRTS